MEDCHHNENRATLKDLTDHAPEEVGKVLKCYDYDTDGPYIIKELHKHYKKELQTAAQYLKHIPTNLIKDDLVKAIVSRIDNLLLEQCRKCKNYYSVGREEEPSVSCSNCGQGAHDSCYKDLNIADYPGIQYLCSRCGNLKEPSKVDTGIPAPAADTTILERSSSHSHSSHFMHSDITHDNLDEDDGDHCPICQRL